MSPKPKKIRTPIKFKTSKGGGGMKKDTKPQDDQKRTKLFGSSNGLKFKKILKQFKDGEDTNGRVHFSTEPNTIFTSSNKHMASSRGNFIEPDKLVLNNLVIILKPP